MRDPRFRHPFDWADLDAELRRLLESAGVKIRLVLLEESLTALSQRRSCQVTLGRTTRTVDLVQVRILSRCFLVDASPQVRRRLARRVADLDSRERVPLLARLLWDPDESVRRIAERNVHEVASFLASPREGALSPPTQALAVPQRRRSVTAAVPGNPETFSVRGTRGKVFSSPLAADLLPSGDALPNPAFEVLDLAPPELREAVVRRFTQCDFAANPQRPSTGRITFALRVEQAGPDSRPVDLRIAAGQAAATVLVHAFSSQFKIGPEVWAVQVPRAADSDVAEFAVEADKPGEGEAGLLVYDEHRLIGSLIVKLRALDTPQGLTLEQTGSVVFRDPAPSTPTPSNGVTVQVSLTAEDRIAFHLLLPLPEAKEWQPNLFPLGRSADRLAADGLQAALASLRETVDEIEQGLDKPAALGAASADEALQAIRLNLEGAGRQISEDIFTPVVRAVLASLPLGSVVHWVIRDSALDAIPWELAWNPATGHAFTQDLVLVRVPVRGDPAQGGGGSVLPTVPALPPAPDRLLYVLGANVATSPAQFPEIRKVVQSVGGYEVETNFDGGKREPLGVLQLRDKMSGAKLVHLLCHGIVEKDKGLYLEIEENVLGRLTPLQVRGFKLPPNAVVFINACSSAAATFSVTGLKTFGWSFLAAGARAYIGTLAPVTTTLALRFAQALFAGHLTRKLPLTQAMFEARQSFAGELNPTWLLYTLYGDLSEAPQSKE
jgi:hypothetical protein